MKYINKTLIIISMFTSTSVYAYKLNVSLNPDPPRMGKQGVLIKVSDDGGKPVATDVSLVAIMPEMPGMPEMASKGKIEVQGSSIMAKFNLSMQGRWYLDIKVGKEQQSFKYELDTGEPGVKAISAIPKSGTKGSQGHQ